MNPFKIVKGLSKVRIHRGALFLFRENKLLKDNGKTIARDRANTGRKSKSFAIGVASGWNLLPEKVVKIGSVGEFK